MTSEEFKVTDWRMGKKILRIDSERIEECMTFYRKKKIDGIIITPTIKGFNENLQHLEFPPGYDKNNIDFLSEHTYVKGVILLDAKTVDISALSYLKDLEFLSIDDNTQLFEFNQFPHLRGLCGDWYSKLNLMTLPDSLELLHLHKYKPKSKALTELPELNNLNELIIIESSIHSLDGIEIFRNLRRIELAYLRVLENIAAIEKLHDANLEVIECENCPRIDDYEPLGKIRSLKTLYLHSCKEIKSISFIKNLISLKQFRFMQTKITDGDLSPLFELPRLEGTAFTRAKHYSHTIKQIEEHLAGKKY